MKSGFKLLSIVFFTMLSSVGNAQYLNKEIDFYQTSDFASDILLLDSGQVFVFGGGLKFDTPAYQLQWLQYSLPDNIVIKTGRLLHPGAALGVSYGNTEKLYDGTTASAFTLFCFPGTSQERCFAGLLKIDLVSLDTVFTRLYTDTSSNYEAGEKVIMLPDSSFMICGERAYKTGAYPYTGLLYKADKNGNKIWRRTYDAAVSDLGTFLQSIQYLGGDTVLIGGYARDYQESTVEFINRPYFALLDTAGNVLHERFYSSGYRGGGNIYKDKNGGYYHWGNLDSLIDASQPMSGLNHPGYVARLDDSFNFVWTYVIYDTVPSPYHSNVKNILQLSDSNYLVMASHISNDVSGIEAKVMKISKDGNLIWQHRFHVDTGAYDCYLVDAVERPDKGLLLVGEAKNAFNPVPWNQDFWLVGLDSNGCIEAGCSPTGVVQLPPKAAEGVKVYPNPTTGSITVSVPEQGRISVVNPQGQVVGAYKLQKGDNKITLATSLPAGLYLGAVQLAGGKKETVRISLIR